MKYAWEAKLSEHQTYEFLAVDRSLSEADRSALRAISSRAEITRNSFTNSYDYGDLRGDPMQMLARWFDVFVYTANWGTHRAAIRLPGRLVDRPTIEAFVSGHEGVAITEVGDDLLVDVISEDDEADTWDEDDPEWASALAAVRAMILEGDLRPFYLVWLSRIRFQPWVTEQDEEDDDYFLADTAVEPISGIGPLTKPLQTFAEFFRVDFDLVAAASERAAPRTGISTEQARSIIGSLSGKEKDDLLLRAYNDDPQVRIDLQVLVRDGRPAAPTPASDVSGRRSVGELRARASELRDAALAAQAAAAEAERQREAEAAAKAQRDRIQSLATRGEAAWTDVETAIEKRNATGYAAATALLVDLKVLADEAGTMATFRRRLAEVRQRHSKKRALIVRLEAVE